MIEENKTIFSVKVDPESSVKRRLVSGPIWLETGSESFPGRGWIDFPVVILGFWLTNLQPLLELRAKSTQLHFMDGPYSCNVEASSPDHWMMTFVQRNAQGALFTSAIEASIVVEQVIAAADVVARFCRQHQWIDSDLEALESSLQAIKLLRSKNLRQ